MTTVELIDRLNHLYKIAPAIEAGQPIEVYVPNREMWVTPHPEDLARLVAGIVYPSDGDEPTKFRVAPKPEPKLPSGMFWVRNHTTKTEPPARLVMVVDTAGRQVRLASLASDVMTYPAPFKSLFAKYHWSRDRVTWFTFDNHETPVAQ